MGFDESEELTIRQHVDPRNKATVVNRRRPLPPRRCAMVPDDRSSFAFAPISPTPPSPPSPPALAPLLAPMPAPPQPSASVRAVHDVVRQAAVETFPVAPPERAYLEVSREPGTPARPTPVLKPDPMRPVVISDFPGRPGNVRRRGIAAVVVTVAIACSIIAAAVMPKPGTLIVRLRTPDGKPAAHADIFVDGKKFCDTDPCRVPELPAGERTVKVIADGQTRPHVARVVVEEGKERVVWIALEKPFGHCVSPD